MTEELEKLLLEIAGFLNLIEQGLIPVPNHAHKQAGKLLEKIGKQLADGQA